MKKLVIAILLMGGCAALSPSTVFADDLAQLNLQPQQTGISQAILDVIFEKAAGILGIPQSHIEREYQCLRCEVEEIKPGVYRLRHSASLWEDLLITYD